MQIFLDTADLGQIERWLEEGVVDGVTTNPTIALRDGVHDLAAFARRLAARIAPRPLSVEVTARQRAAMLAEARALAGLGPNVAVKIPVVTEDGDSCLGVVSRLVSEGVVVNVTAVLSFNQAILAAKAGAHYVSLFAGRVGDEGHDAATLIRAVRAWLDDWAGAGIRSRLLVGSLRGVYEVQAAAAAGAHVVTIPPAVLARMVDHRYSRETVRQFSDDAARAGAASATSVVVGAASVTGGPRASDADER